MTRRSFIRIIVTGAMLGGGATDAMAQANLHKMFPPGAARCYQGKFPAKAPVGKKVDRIWLSASLEHLKQDKAGDLIMLDLRVRLRNWKVVRTAGIICHKQADDTWTCSEHACNDHPVVLKPKPSGREGWILDLQGGLTLQGACGSAEGQSQLELRRFDQVYWLTAVAPQACR